MKRLLKYILLLLLPLSFVSCGDETGEIMITRLSLSKSELTLRKGDIHSLSIIIAPNNASDQRIVWASSNSEIVTVSDGLVSAVEVGSAKIYATTADNRKRAVCEVTVVPEYIPVEAVVIMDDAETSVLSGTTIELYAGDVLALVASFQPGDATNQNVFWASSDPTIVSVKNGLIKALSVGSAVITVTSDAGEKQASCTIRVNEYVPPIDVTDVRISSGLLVLPVGDSYQFEATVLPVDATNKSLTWTCSDDKIAVVDQSGKVSAISTGTATITVRTKDGGYTATSTIVVREAGSVALPLAKGGWKMLYASSECPQDYSGQLFVREDDPKSSMTGYAKDIIDGSYASIWAYNYKTPDAAPYYFVIDMGAQYTITALDIWAQRGNRDLSNSQNTSFVRQCGEATVEFANTLSGNGMGSDTVWSGKETFTSTQLLNKNRNIVMLTTPTTARYIRFCYAKGYSNETETQPTLTAGGALAELDLIGY